MRWVRVVAIAAIMLLPATVRAGVRVGWTHPGPLAADSSNFVTASIVIASPGNEVYGNLGHCALRMECPVWDLDYCYSFEMNADAQGVLAFFAGQADGHVVSVPTSQCIASYERDGRGVTQIELNLTVKQEQTLWRMLDEDVVDSEERKFNFLRNNCTSVTLRMLDNCTGDERLDFAWPQHVSLSNGEVIHVVLEYLPWMEWTALTLIGTAADDRWDNTSKISPSWVIAMLERSYIVDAAGGRRPATVGKARELVPRRLNPASSPCTPVVVFGILLLVVVLFTLAQTRWGWRKAGIVLDTLLLAAQTLMGVVLLWLMVGGNLYGNSWNWYLVPYCPLAWLVCIVARRGKWQRWWWLDCSVVLVLFIAATPLSAQLTWVHQLPVATLLVRTLWHWHVNTKTNNSLINH